MFRPNKNIEPKNSTINWSKADPITKKRLTDVLVKKNKVARIVGNLFFFLVIGAILFVIGYCIDLAIKNQDIIVFYLIIILFGCILLGVCIYGYIKGRPYMYPEKQSEIWIFRTKCSRIGESSRYTLRDETNHGYFAFFNSKAGQICMLIPYAEYISNPVSKEYIFYKFNNRTGNRWTNIAAEKVDEIV